MKRQMKVILMAAVALFLMAQAAVASMLIPLNERAAPAPAPERSPAIADGWSLERIDFIHYAKPSNPGNSKPAGSCYKLIGYKWKTLPVSYVINPANPQGLTADFIASKLSLSAETWDGATSSELFNDSYTLDSSAAYGTQDFRNSIAFGDYADNNVIAVTSIWYTRKAKQIVEFDMLFNTRFSWGDAVLDPSKMDLQNIAAHEMGHAAGLDDIYSTSCSAVTEYGYSDYGETQKRTLEPPDITGLQAMYGL